MNVIRAPLAAVRYGPSTISWTIGNAMKPTLAATANDRRIRKVTAINPMLIANGIVAKTAAPPANVRMLRPPRKSREDREGVADHRRGAPDVGEAPCTGVGQQRADECCHDAFRAVTDEHGHRRPYPERRSGVPETGIAVADVAQVEPRPTRRDQVGDRDRPDQVPDDDRDCHLGAHR